MNTSVSSSVTPLGLIAILRGVQPHESVSIAQALYDEGFRVIEVPMNSPEPLQSIALIRKALPADCLVGAGTVLSPEMAQSVKDAGGQIIIMPHADTAVIRQAKAMGMWCVPGVGTVTEAFAALAAGADALKLFPAEQLGVATLKAWMSVLPKGTAILPVGGVNPDNMQSYVSAGAKGFGLGSALYKP
ncbi:MAG: 2-dehydro-3-deoxy-6-phosphogalactonate aldolase, partial [Comamonas sp.]